MTLPNPNSNLNEPTPRVIRTRSLEFDILKTIGIFCIILAHTLPKTEVFIYQLRNFDVPLMVMVSGALFWITSANANYSYIQYLKKRVSRLILPIWCFWVFFFTISILITGVQGVPYPFSLKEIFYSFTLLIGGVGYVWIIRVFLLIALISPFILTFKKQVKNNWIFLLLISVIYGGYEILVNWFNSLPLISISSFSDFLYQRIFISLLMSQIILLLIPYSLLFALGIVMTQIPQKKLLAIALGFAIIFVTLAINYSQDAGSFVLTQNYKYPPRLYYISYSILMTIVSYLIASYVSKNHSKFLKKTYLEQAFIYLSSSSLWIYLWHIFFLYYWKPLVRIFAIDPKVIPEFWVVASLSILMVYLQKTIVSSLCLKLPLGEKGLKWLKIALLQ
ncbi:acyltransferase [Crocosphaera sp. XPORK-15E]|uniref:acyltransferase n=1 Tax=Crocosphaera sp. XPORK-15E TaxID=3110247 RepID=UPI002B1F746D|nr:acyltransferase [Crocosphaera sp. XPORK-15E]MEA5532490.1 acyltransferase [Crocosphaera sp. XPORK-15E]